MNSRAMTVFERQQHSTWNICRPAFSSSWLTNPSVPSKKYDLPCKAVLYMYFDVKNWRDAESESKFINSLQILHPFNFLHQKIYSAHLSNSKKLMRVNPEAEFTNWSIQEEFEDKREANLHGYILIAAVYAKVCAIENCKTIALYTMYFFQSEDSESYTSLQAELYIDSCGYLGQSTPADKLDIFCYLCSSAKLTEVK